MAWSDAAIGEEGYTLERALTSDFADAATFTLPAGSQSFVDVGLQPQTQYWYRVRAEKGAAPSAWVPLSVQTLPLSSTLAAPGALQVTAATNTSLALGWTDQAVGETHYVLLRSGRSDFASGSVERFILGADAESLLDTGLVAGTGYWYRLFAASGTEASPIVELEAATVLPAPTSLAFQGQSFVDVVSFTWTDLADNEDYYLDGWSADGSEWFVIDELPANATTYTDEFPVIGIDNHYRLRAGRAGESIVESQPSNEAARRPIAPGVAWYDDNAGANERGTLSPHAVAHNDADGLTFSVLPNDVDYDAGVLSIPPDGFTQPPHGEITLNSVTGEFTYVPNGQFVGTDTFTYWVTDGEALSAPATVSIDVTNEVPQASGSSSTWGECTLGSVHYPYVGHGQMSGTDDDGDTITFIITDEPDFGTLNRNAETGAWVYLPGPNFPGSDSFVFVVEDSLQARSLPQRVVINGDEARVTVSAVRTVQPNFDPLSGLGVNIPPYSLNLPGMSFSVAEANLPQHGTLHVHWVEEEDIEGGAVTVLVSHHAPLVPGQWYDHHDLLFKPTSGFAGVDDLHIDYRTEQQQCIRPQHIRLHVTSQSQDVRLLDVGDPQRGVPVEALFQSAQSQQPVELIPDLRAWSGVTATSDTLAVSVLQQPEQGTLSVDGNRLLYQPILVAGQLDPRWQFGLISLSVNSQPTLEQWVQVDPGYVPPPPRLLTNAPESDWVQVPFDGTLDDLENVVSAAEESRQEVIRGLEALGRAWQPLGVTTSSSPEVVLDSLSIEVISKFDALDTLYNTYLDGYLQVHGNAASYQNGWQAYLDNLVSPSQYTSVFQRINSLPRDIAGLRPNAEFAAKIREALDEFGDAAGFQAKLAGTVFTVAEQTHKNLERAEYALGLLSGGTYTAAVLKTRAGLTAMVRNIAKNYLVMEGTEFALTPVMSQALVWAAAAGVDPRLLQAGMVALQATAAIKLFKARCTAGSCFLAGTQVVTGVDANGVFSTKSIEDLQVGDTVLARDQHDSADDLDLRPVTNVFRKTSNHIRTLTLVTAAGTETIATTDEHPFWLGGAGWVGAGELTVGQRVVLIDGSDAMVASTERAEHPDGITVYNLEVEADHTYFVADADTSFTSPVWVHNAGPCGGPNERFGRAADAIGDLNDQASLIKRARTRDAQWQEWGYTETHYYRDSNGTKWTVFFNPRSGEYSGAHPSSSQNT